MLWCYFSKYSTPLVCYTAGDGVPSSASALGLHKGRRAGKQEGASTVPEPLQHTQTCTHPKTRASDLALVRLLLSACLFSGGPVAALSLSLFLTDLAGFYCSPVLLAGRTTKSGGFMCPNTHAGAVREGSSRGEEVFADRCLCLKCPCVFRP